MKPSDITPNMCPLCRADNQCAVELGQRVDQCWCHQPNVSVPAELLLALPEAVKGNVCLCQACIEKVQHTKMGKVQQISPRRE